MMRKSRIQPRLGPGRQMLMNPSGTVNMERAVHRSSGPGLWGVLDNSPRTRDS